MLQAIVPLTITDAMLLAHSEPEADYAAWSSGTTYALGARVIKGHRVWEGAQASNLNHDPELAASNAWWINVGPTNRWAMFDGSVSTATIGATATLAVTVQPDDFVNAAAVVAALGAEVRITMVYAGQTVYDQTQTINAGTLPNPYDWCFGAIDTPGDVVFASLPNYLGAQITVTISGGAAAQCGVLVLGKAYELGEAERGAEAGIIDYSRKETDAFGTATLLQRAYAKRMTLQLVVDRLEVRRVHTVLSDLRATPVLWVGHSDTDTFGPFVVFGWYRDFRVVIEYAQFSRCALEIEGLT